MNDRALDPSPALEQIALHATMGALLLWSGVLAREWPRLAAGGAICGEPEGLFGHCVLCWPAAALTGVAAVTLIRVFSPVGRRG